MSDNYNGEYKKELEDLKRPIPNRTDVSDTLQTLNEVGERMKEKEIKAIKDCQLLNVSEPSFYTKAKEGLKDIIVSSNAPTKNEKYNNCIKAVEPFYDISKTNPKEKQDIVNAINAKPKNK